DRVGLGTAPPSLLMVQLAVAVSPGLFLVLGLLLAGRALPSSPALVRIMQWLLLLEALAVTGFVAVQMRGVLAGGHGLLDRVGVSGGARAGEAAAHIDRALAAYYRHQPRRLMLSLTYNFFGWVTRAVETWLILYLIGAPVSVSMALIIE